MGKAKETMCMVFDTSTSIDERTRTHQILLNDEIKDIVFHYGKPTKLPESIALKFNQEGFRVFEEDGETLYKTPSKAEDNPALNLAKGEVIARLDELNQEALFIRCALEKGGEVFDAEAPAEDMVTFLLHGKLPTPPIDSIADGALPNSKPKAKAKPKVEVKFNRAVSMARLKELGVRVGNISNDKMEIALADAELAAEKAKVPANDEETAVEDNGNLSKEQMKKMLDES